MTEELSKEELKDRKKYFNTCKKIQASIVLHDKYEYFSNYLRDWEYSILKQVGQSESYNDLPNLDVINMLKRIKERMLKSKY